MAPGNPPTDAKKIPIFRQYLCVHTQVLLRQPFHQVTILVLNHMLICKMFFGDVLDFVYLGYNGIDLNKLKTNEMIDYIINRYNGRILK